MWLSGNYNSIYCDNIPKGKNISCKKLGPMLVYKNKMKANEILKIYNRLYKKYYAKRGKSNFTPEKFLVWSDSSRIVRQYALSHYMSPQEFEKAIDTPIIDIDSICK